MRVRRSAQRASITTSSSPELSGSIIRRTSEEAEDLAKAKRVVAVESPIDALSYHSLFARPNDSLAVVSCAGATIPQALMFQAYHRCQSFVVALDNDPAGERGWVKAQADTMDWMGFKLSSESPKHKDWNDGLVAAVQCLRSPKSKKSASLKL